METVCKVCEAEKEKKYLVVWIVAKRLFVRFVRLKRKKSISTWFYGRQTVCKVCEGSY